MLADVYREAVSAGDGTGQVGDANAWAHARRLERCRARGPGIVVTGSRDGRLGGFALAHVIGTRGYLEEVVLSDEACPWHVRSGLYWQFVTAAAAAGATEICVGLSTPDLASLQKFKKSVGARIEDKPSITRFNPAVDLHLRKRRPATYERLGGPHQVGQESRGLPGSQGDALHKYSSAASCRAHGQPVAARKDYDNSIGRPLPVSARKEPKWTIRDPH